MSDNEKVTNSHHIECYGIDFEREEVDEEPEEVIVRIYESGRSIPLCRHFNRKNGVCLAVEEEEKRGECPYYDLIGL